MDKTDEEDAKQEVRRPSKSTAFSSGNLRKERELLNRKDIQRSVDGKTFFTSRRVVTGVRRAVFDDVPRPDDVIPFAAQDFIIPPATSR